MQNLVAGFIVSLFIHVGIILSASNLFDIDYILSNNSTILTIPAYLVIEEEALVAPKKNNKIEKIFIPSSKDQERKSIEFSPAEELKKIINLPKASYQSKNEIVLNVQTRKEVLYFSSMIQDQIREVWKKPLITEGLVVEIELKLLPTGEILDSNVIKTSGNKNFDLSALSAITRVGKFVNISMPSKLFDKNFRKFTLVFSAENL
jgi:colicin import membrane protein